MMKNIYRGGTYQFDLPIKENKSEVDVSDDEVILYLDTKTKVETPVLSITANVSTGLAKFELPPDATLLLTEQEYLIQAKWTPFGTTKKFIVLDDKVKIKPVIK